MGDLAPHLVVGDVVEIFEDTADRVAVGGDEDSLAALQGGDDVGEPAEGGKGDRGLSVWGRVLGALGVWGPYGHFVGNGSGRAASPVGQRALDGVLQALGQRQVRLSDVRVLVLIARPVLGRLVDGGRRGGVGTAPLVDLMGEGRDQWW
eukprot:scaffold14586_cov72-Isochrysis_galbana.AAC.1